MSMRMTEEEYKAFLARNNPKNISFGVKPEEKKPSKYRNRKVLYTDPKSGEEILFDSEKERDHYLILKDRERKGEITDLRRQVSFVIQPPFTDLAGNKHRAIKYLADFCYTTSDNVYHVIDVKGGFKTEIYKLKKKLLAYKGIIIEEV